MIILSSITIIISLFIYLQFYKYKKVKANKRLVKFKKGNLYKWMNLTKKERYDLSKKDSFNYLSKRKILLDKIRKEYKSISKSDLDKL